MWTDNRFDEDFYKLSISIHKEDPVSLTGGTIGTVGQSMIFLWVQHLKRLACKSSDDLNVTERCQQILLTLLSDAITAGTSGKVPPPCAI